MKLNLEMEIDDNMTVNDLRRKVLDLAFDFAVSNIKRVHPNCVCDNLKDSQILCLNGNTANVESFMFKENTISVLLNILNPDFDYSKLEGFDNIYIPLKYFSIKKYSDILKTLEQKFKIYIYMPTIIKANYRNLLFSTIEKTISNYNIKGFVISNISNLKLLENVLNNPNNKFELITPLIFSIYIV